MNNCFIIDKLIFLLLYIIKGVQMCQWKISSKNNYMCNSSQKKIQYLIALIK